MQKLKEYTYNSFDPYVISTTIDQGFYKEQELFKFTNQLTTVSLP